MTNSEVLVDALRMADELKANARSTDEHGLSAEAVERLARSGLLQAATPAQIMENGRALGKGCGATAWLATSLATGASILATAEEGIRRGIEGAQVAFVGALDEAQLSVEDGEVRLTGRLGQTGGLDHANWLVITGLVFEGKAVAALVNKSDVQLSSYPYRGGLRGLKWQAVILDQAQASLIPLSVEAQAQLGEDVVLLGALMGVAQGGYDDYVSATRARISGIGGQSVAQFTQVQARLAETHADLKALTSVYMTVLERVAAGEADHPECRRDRAFIARKSIEALNRLLSQMGAMGLSETNPVQRRFRDLRALGCARGLDWVEHMPAFGRFELGLTQ